jgi:hypothetical protein
MTIGVLALLASLTNVASASAASSLVSGLAAPAVESPEAPAITKIAPDTGPVVGGTAVSITGRNFVGATEVDFGSTPASFTVSSADKIGAVAPSGTEGSVEITVTTPAGTSAASTADRFFYVPPGPSVLELVPNEGAVAGGKEVKILGAHFEGVSEVSFGGVSASFAVVSAEGIRATTPAGIEPTVNVRVTTAEGVSPVSPADVYSYRSKPPQISGLSPDKGPAAGETTVGISGDEFYGVTGVKFGELPATSFKVNSPGSITAVAPAETAEKVVVHVETTFGPSELEYCKMRGDLARCQIKDYYRYEDPAVTGVTPSAGPLAGGTPVTFTGSGFGLAAGETSFTIGGNPTTDVECTSNTTCTGLTPAGRKAGLSAAVIVSVASNEPKHSRKNPDAEFHYE